MESVSAWPYANHCTSLQTDNHTNTSSLTFRSSLCDDLIDLLKSGVSVHPSIHTSTKFFWFRCNLVCGQTSTAYARQHDLDPIQDQGQGASEVPKNALLTWSKVKVKVTDFLNFHKLHFSMPISSAIWCGAQNDGWLRQYWKYSTAIWSQIYEFLPTLAVTWLKSLWNVDITGIHLVLSLRCLRLEACDCDWNCQPPCGAFYLQDGCSSECPTNTVKALKASTINNYILQ